MPWPTFVAYVLVPWLLVVAAIVWLASLIRRR